MNNSRGNYTEDFTFDLFSQEQWNYNKVSQLARGRYTYVSLSVIQYHLPSPPTSPTASQECEAM